MTQTPASALWLGWIGVMPFAALAGFSLFADAETSALALGALRAYAMVILGFMGGVQWGLEMTRSDGEGPGAAGFAASVVPALVAFATWFMPPVPALFLLVAGFMGLLAYDLQRVRLGIGPAWYGRLRWQLSAAVVLCLAAATRSAGA